MAENTVSEELITSTAQQMILPPRMTGRSFLSRLSRILVLVSFLQVALSLLIRITGLASLQFILFLIAAYFLFDWFLDRVQETRLTLANQEIHLAKISIGSERETRIPITEIIAVRRHSAGEDLDVTYHPVFVLQRSLKPVLRIRVSWMASYLSARLARLIAGEIVFRFNGIVLVQKENGSKKGYLLPADESFLAALRKILPKQFELDDRMEDEPLVSLRGRLLQRAFPVLYPHILPLNCEDNTTDIIKRSGRKKKNSRLIGKTKKNKNRTNAQTMNQGGNRFVL